MNVAVLVYDPQPRTRPVRSAAVRSAVETFFGHCEALTLYVADDAATFPSPSPFPLWGPRPVALVDATTSDVDLALGLATELEGLGFVAHAWVADRSIPMDHGGNANGPARDWPDGSPSPGPVTVNLLRRPGGLSVDQWLHRWHTVMSPVSEQIQPRTRYVRHHLTEELTPHGTGWDGIAVESWPSVKHIRSPMRFFGATSRWQLVQNQLAILRAVSHCFRVWQVHTQPMTEIFLKTP